MKKLNQKQWGILGTSLGSVLIIVALLTMVGIGSGDTYAATTCTCPDGWKVEGGQCVYRSTQTEKCNDSSCSNVVISGSLESCGSTQYDSTRKVYYKECTAKFTKACSENGTPVVCSAGTYYQGNGSTSCSSCTSGYYCPGGTFKTTDTSVGGRISCPSNATCTVSSFTCNDGYEPNGSGGCKEKKKCAAGSYKTTGDYWTICPVGSYCPGDGTIKTCPPDKPKSKAGSSSVSDCKTSGSDTSYVHCDKGWFYTGDGKTCTKCPSGSWCPGGNFLASSLVRDGGVKCPDDRPYSEPGSYRESDCKASGSGGGTGGSGGSGSGGSTGGNTGGSTGGNSGGSTGGSTGGNNSNTNTNPNTATKTPLAIALIGMLAIGVGTVTYYKGKNNEI